MKTKVTVRGDVKLNHGNFWLLKPQISIISMDQYFTSTDEKWPAVSYSIEKGDKNLIEKCVWSEGDLLNTCFVMRWKWTVYHMRMLQSVKFGLIRFNFWLGFWGFEFLIECLCSNRCCRASSILHVLFSPETSYGAAPLTPYRLIGPNSIWNAR